LTPENTLRDNSEASFVPLHKLGSPAEAEMVNDILMQNGIRSVVKAGGSDALSPLLSATSEGAVILVDERDADRAAEKSTGVLRWRHDAAYRWTIEEDYEDEDEKSSL
jgi:hypothetical protein